MKRVVFVAAAAAALLACQRGAPRLRHQDPVVTRVPKPAPAPVHATTLAAKLRDPPAHLESKLPDVVVHVPAGLARGAPLHLVVFFHGSGEEVETMIEGGGLGGRHDASDDDGAGFFDPHLVFRAPRPAAYTVRVTTAGSGEKRGAYTLHVR